MEEEEKEEEEEEEEEEERSSHNLVMLGECLKMFGGSSSTMLWERELMRESDKHKEKERRIIIANGLRILVVLN